MVMTAPAASIPPLSRDARVIGLVGAAHFFSHFYQLVLPSLFVFMAESTGRSYVELGLLVTVFSVMSGVAQTPIGIMVDKIGARWPLIIGSAVLSASVLGYGLVGSYEGMLVLAVIGGTANAIYHPADFSILAGKVHEKRLGRAFSLHSVFGNMGWALAPVVMVPLASFYSIETAFIVAGCMGLATSAVLVLQVGHLDTDSNRAKRVQRKAKTKPATTDAANPGWKLLLTRAALLLLAFQIIHAMAFGGIRNFSVAALTAFTDNPTEWIAAALTGYLIGASFGSLAGGYAADKTGRPHLIFYFSILSIAAMTALIGTVDMPAVVLVIVFVIAGALNGTLLPVRDLLVRALAPKEQLGTLYGFTSSGLSLGNAITPLIYGWLMDNGNPRWIFYTSAILMLGALATYVEARNEQVK
jgi:MFS transporter, FSR family, fosmidomycin resistance protein